MDRDIESVVMKCLEKEPSRRYPSAGEQADDLDRFLRAEPVRARRISWAGRTWRKAVRHRVVVIPCATAALVVAAVLAWVGAGAWTRSREVEASIRQVRARESEADHAVDLPLRRALYEAAGREISRVLASDGGNEEALAARSRLDARLAEVRAAEEAERVRLAMEKAECVDEVSARFADLAEAVLWPMERTLYDADLTREEQRRRNEEGWRAVLRFVEETPGDGASQATMRAWAGWARRLEGYEEEGLEWMGQAERLDPEVPYGALLRGLVHLTRYVEGQALPIVRSGGRGGVEFGPAPGETPQMRQAREEMERAQQDASGCVIWGKGEVKRQKAALEAVRAVQRGAYIQADDALTKALSRRELAPLRWTLLFARGQARYLQKRFDDALKDIQEVKSVRAAHPGVWACEGLIWQAKAEEESQRGGDPRDCLNRAIACLDRVVGWNHGGADAYNDRGLATQVLANAELAHGVDPGETYRKSAADLEEALKRSPTHPWARINRGNSLLRWGELERGKGVDPRAMYRRAIADFDAVLAADPTLAEAYVNRGNAYCSLGEADQERGADPIPCYRKAIADFDEALRRNPRLWMVHTNKGLLHEMMSEPQAAIECYERALAIVGDNYPPLQALLARARGAAPARPRDHGSD